MSIEVNEPMVHCELLRRSEGVMSTIMFAKNYMVFETGLGIRHWVQVHRIRQLREKMVRMIPENEKSVVVSVLFEADGFNYEVANLDVIQFLMEVFLATEVKIDEVVDK